MPTVVGSVALASPDARRGETLNEYPKKAEGIIHGRASLRHFKRSNSNAPF